MMTPSAALTIDTASSAEKRTRSRNMRQRDGEDKRYKDGDVLEHLPAV